MHLEKGFAHLIVIIIATLLIGVAVSGFLLSREEKTDVSQKVDQQTSDNRLSPIQEKCAQKPLVPKGKYQGLLTDVHVHTMIRDDAFAFALKLLDEMNEQGVDKIVIQPNHSPAQVKENSLLDKAWGEIASVCPRILPLIYGFNSGDPTSWMYVKELLEGGNYGGVGEIEFQHGNMDIKQDPQSESMIKIYEMLNEKGLALSFQASIQRDPSLEEKMFTIIKRYPNISFIWFGGCPIAERFIGLPNLYCNIFVHSKTYPTPSGVLQKSVIGSDAGPKGFWNGGGLLPYESFGGAMAEAREQLGKLPEGERDTLANGNFNKIWKKQIKGAKVQGVEAQGSELQWEKAPVTLGDVAEIAISKTNPDVMYAGIEVNSHSLYKSEDGGKKWRRIDGGGDHTKDVAVSPKDPNKVYFALSDTIHSTDLNVLPTVRSQTSPARPGGETIDIFSFGRSAGTPGGLLSTLEIFDQDDKIIYAAMTGGGLGPRVIGKPMIFKTENGGNNWTEIKPDLVDINAVEIHPTNHQIIYIGTSDGIYVSRDSGKTVERLKETKALGGFISVEAQKDNPNVLYIASASEVFKSEDGGKSWQDIKGSLSNIHRVRVSLSHPNILYAATFNGVFRSDNYGKTWENKTSNLKGKNIQIVTIHPENPDIAFIGHSSLWSSVRAGKRYKQALWADNGIFKTEDGGNSWFRSDEGIYEYTLEEVAVSPHKSNEAWISAPASVGGHKTEDAGHNWLLTQIHTLHYPMRIKYSMQNPNKIYATSWHPGGPIAVSLDGGASWKVTNEQEFFKGINRGKNLYKVGSGQQIEPIHLHGLAVDPKNDNIVYSGSVHDTMIPGEKLLEGSHIWKSIDGGKSWQESDEGFPHQNHTAIHDIQIDPKDTNIIYVATTEHEAKIGIGIYKSEDGGKSWKEINNGLGDVSVGAIAVHPEDTQLLIAATHDGIYKSSNAGNSWEKTSSSHSFDVEYVQNESNTLYASTNDGVLKSQDFGDSWYEVNLGLPAGEGQGIGVSIDGNVIYAAVKWQGVYVARMKPVDPIEPESYVTKRGAEYAFGLSSGEDFSDTDSDTDSDTSRKDSLFPKERTRSFTRILNFFKRIFSRM